MGSIVRSAFAPSILPFLTAAVWAGGFPRRPVTIVVPAAPGGGDDTTTRLLARGLERAFGRAVVVGLTTLVEAAPDGQTVGLPFPHVGYEYTGPAIFTRADFGPIAHFDDAAAPVAAAGSPDVVKARETAVREAVESPEFRAATAEADFGVEWLSADELSAPTTHRETETGRVVGALGLRQVTM